MSITGIDVSHHNGAIDWPAVARSGISFAFIKATEGVRTRDSRFCANWIAAAGAGLRTGAYHFFHPLKPVQDQVDNFCSLLATVPPGSLPPVLDVEETLPPDEWPVLPRRRRLEVCLEWLRGVERHTGLRPAIYTRRSFVTAMFGAPGPLASYPLWIAHYTLRPAPACPPGWPWTFWQYTQSGRVPGIAGDVDMNRFRGEALSAVGVAGQVTRPPAANGRP